MSSNQKMMDTVDVWETFFIFSICYILGYFNFTSLWILIFSGLYGWKIYFWNQNRLRRLQLQTIAMQEKESVLELLQSKMKEVPNWVHFPDQENVVWVNKMVTQIWPFVNAYANQLCKVNIQPAVQQSLPMLTFEFETVDCGDIAPKVNNVQTYITDSKDRITLDLNISWSGDARFMVKIGPMSAGIDKIEFSGILRVVLEPLMPKPPMVGAVSAFFMNPPSVDFNLTGIGNFIEIPGVMGFVKNAIEEQIRVLCVLPHSITVPMTPTFDMAQFAASLPDGIIRINIIEAKELEGKDVALFGKKTSDPYATIAVGAEKFKTQVVKKTTEPLWNETYETSVMYCSGQKLIIELYDWDRTTGDDFIGSLSIGLSDVRERKRVEEWYRLEKAKQGKVHLHLTWLDLSAEMRYFTPVTDPNSNCGTAALVLYIQNATNLIMNENNEPPTTGVKFNIEGKKYQTTQVGKTNDPKYGKKFVIILNDPNTADVRFNVFEYNTKQSLGTQSVEIKSLFSCDDLDDRKQLRLINTSVQGVLNVTLRLRALVDDHCY